MDRKRQIVEVAAEILRHKSFRAFSYQDVARELGIRKASIHHHFDTKETLALALLDFYAANGQAMMEELARRHETPGERLRAFLDGAEALLLDGKGQVCPHGVFEVDSGDLPDAVVARLDQLHQGQIGGLAAMLQAARADGEIDFPGEPGDEARLIMVALQGARTVGLPDTRPTLFRGVVRQLKRGLGLE